MYRWLTKESQIFLERGYLLPGQTVDERVDIICNRAEEILGIDGFAKRLKENFKKGWYSFSTPIWCNFGTDRGLPISCFNSMIDDTMDSIMYTAAEVGIMTKYGGGTSGYFGRLRERGSEITNNGYSSGPVHFMQMFDTVMNVTNQGSSRRGNFAAYLDIEHPDILEFLEIREEGNPIQDMSFGVCIGDEWFKSMIDGDVEKRKIWARLLQRRYEVGYPYIFFTDNVNNNAPDVYKDKGLKIHGSNLCSEIALHSSSEESFVCNLSSMNILHYDEWKDTDAVCLLTFFLDAVMTEFIEKAKNIRFLERAVNFAERQRALGIGWLGWHSYLQSKMIPFESMEAKLANIKVAKKIKEDSYDASKELAILYGEPELMKGYGRRNVTTMAIAPTKSSAYILGQVSEGIEPIKSNYQVNDLAKTKSSYKNPYLISLLEQKGKNTPEVWKSILMHRGSVQHLDFLDNREKDVFKTFSEISPVEVIIQAAQRQKYVDQSQSLNLMIHPDTPVKDLNKLIIFAWEQGVKTLYYQHSMSAAQELNRKLMECKSCEG